MFMKCFVKIYAIYFFLHENKEEKKLFVYVVHKPKCVWQLWFKFPCCLSFILQRRFLFKGLITPCVGLIIFAPMGGEEARDPKFDKKNSPLMSIS